MYLLLATLRTRFGLQVFRSLSCSFFSMETISQVHAGVTDQRAQPCRAGRGGPVPGELPLGQAGAAVFQHGAAVAGGYLGPSGSDGQPSTIS